MLCIIKKSFNPGALKSYDLSIYIDAFENIRGIFKTLSNIEGRAIYKVLS